jgi:NAD(P)-dependent dehydrogenase (short-subunit alcohol dehydrogenase family)
VRELRGRVAVVTGAAGGIGLGIARALATEGARVVLADVDGRALDRRATDLGANGAEVTAVVTDVADPAAVERLAGAALDRFGAVHVIVNNAGIIRPGRSWELPLADWERVIQVNLLGVVHGVRTFVPLLLEAAGRGEEGHVVNVASMAAVVPVPWIGPYNVAKHGVLALSETLHAELAATGAAVGVTVVMPGRVRTRLGLPPAEDGDGDGDGPAADPEPGLLEPDEVGRQVVEAVRDGRLHLFTHPDRIPEVEARFARITRGSQTSR